MTDRINYFVVGLDDDIHTDDLDEIVTALKMIKGVIKVEPHGTGFGELLAKDRARRELINQLRDVLKP